MGCFDVDAFAVDGDRAIGEFDFACAEDFAPVFCGHACLGYDGGIDGDGLPKIDIEVDDGDVVACAPDGYTNDFIENGCGGTAVNVAVGSLLFEGERYFGEDAAVFAGVPD